MWAEETLALALTALAVMGSPGPSTISVTATAAAFGARRSLPYMSGLIVGTEGVLVAVATGVTSLALAVPALVPVLVVLAAAYILHLAYRIATAPPLRPADGTGGDARDLPRRAPSFWAGLLLAIANPKAYIAIAAVYASSDLGGADTAVATLVKTTILAAIIVVIHVVWLLVGVVFATVLRRPVASRIVNVVLAVALVVATAFSVVTAFLP